MFWVIMECSSLVFVGLCLSFLSYGFSSFMLYFIIQALCSTRIFIFYLFSIDFLFTLFIFFKLAVFPFSFWYFPVVYLLPNLVFFICSTFHKFPTIILFSSFSSVYFSTFFLICSVFTILYSSFIMLSLNSLRSLLIFSSIGNNVWMLFSSSISFDLFILFFSVYTLNFFVVMLFLGGLTTLSFSSLSSSYVFSFSLLSSAGFPPFPIFFLKLYIVYSFIFSYAFSSFILFLLLISVVIIISSYFRFIIGYYTNIYSCSINLAF